MSSTSQSVTAANRQASEPHDRVWRPLVFDRTCPDEATALAALRSSGRVWRTHEAILAQLRDLVRTRSPGRVLAEQEVGRAIAALLDGSPVEDYGRWVETAKSGCGRLDDRVIARATKGS